MVRSIRFLSMFVLLSVLLAVLPRSTMPFCTYIDVNVSEAREMMESNSDLVILDVRTQQEYEGGHLENAVLIPVNELEERIGELDKHKETLVYCGSGGRSVRACEMLAANGFEVVYNMLGGITAWRDAGYWIETVLGLTTFFGPEVFVRGRGKPVIETREFSAAGFKAPFVLHLRNGDDDGGNRVSSAMVWLNGELLFGTSDFSQQVWGYDVEVELEGESLLEVELRSKPGSKLEIWIEGVGAEAVADIGPEGGVVEVTDPESPICGLCLDIPAGAVREMTTICVDDLPKDKVDSILSAQKFTSAQKHMLGGFVGEPDGLVFDVPVTASVPVDALSTDGGIPVQAKVLLDEEVYWLEPTDLVYDPIEGMVEMIIQDFSGHAVVELEELLKPPEERLGEVVQQPDPCPCNQALEEAFVPLGDEIPCEELRIHVTSFFVGFAGGDGCQIVGDFVWVKFLDCPGAPTEEAHISETTPECGPDFSLKVEVDPPSAMLFPCKTETLKAHVCHNGKEVSVPVIWENTETPDAGTAEVDMRTGVVKGLREGETVIRARTPDLRYCGNCSITVVGHVCEVDVSPSSDDIFAGETLPLTALPKDVDGNTPPRDRFGNEVEGLTATWRSTDDAIATVDSNGVVNGVSPGEVKIIATVEGVEGLASITVKEPGRVVIVPSSVTISVGETQHFEVTVYDADGYELPGYPVEWIIPPSEVIAFDAVTQTVRGVSPGIAVITATGEGASASATITVTPVEVGSVVIVPEEATISVGETITLEVTVYDKDGYELPDYPVEWTIPPGEIVAFNPATQTVTGVSPGTAEITATCEGKSASATITVTAGVKYRLTWKATAGYCVEYVCFDPVCAWDGSWYRESRDKVFEGYAVIEEVTDSTGNTTYEVTDFWANGHSELHTVLWKAHSDWYHESCVEWEADIYDLTDNGKDEIRQRIEDNFQVLRYPNGSFMKTPNPTWYFFPSLLSPRYEALGMHASMVVHPAPSSPPYSEYIDYDTYRESISDFPWYPYLCRGMATERPEPKFIEYDEKTQTFHLEIEQGALRLIDGWCGSPHFIIVYADHSRCVSGIWGCNGFWMIAYWEINVEVLP